MAAGGPIRLPNDATRPAPHAFWQDLVVRHYCEERLEELESVDEAWWQ